MSLEINDLRFSYGPDWTIGPVDLTILPGTYCVILGKSGSGKSTLLHLIAGLLRPQSGSIRLHDRSLLDVAPMQRNVSMTFQNDRLYPHLTLRQNLRVALPKETTKTASKHAIESVTNSLQITDYLDRLPDQVSGGQLRRAALAKAILRPSAICMLDEPFDALDPEVRQSLLTWIQQRPTDNRIFIHVTHDQDEAMRLADEIVVVDHGQVVQQDTPATVYRHPANQAATMALGTPPANVIPSEWIQQDIHHLAKESPSILIRPESLSKRTDDRSPADGVNYLELNALIDQVRYRGHDWLVEFRLLDPAGQPFGQPSQFRLTTPHQPWHEGENTKLLVAKNDIHVFD